MPNKSDVLVLVSSWEMETPWKLRFQRIGIDAQIAHLDDEQLLINGQQPRFVIADLLSIVDLPYILRRLTSIQASTTTPILACCAQDECANLAGLFCSAGITAIKIRLMDVVDHVDDVLTQTRRSISTRRDELHSQAVSRPHVATDAASILHSLRS